MNNNIYKILSLTSRITLAIFLSITLLFLILSIKGHIGIFMIEFFNDFFDELLGSISNSEIYEEFDVFSFIVISRIFAGISFILFIFYCLFNRVRIVDILFVGLNLIFLTFTYGIGAILGLFVLIIGYAFILSTLSFELASLFKVRH